MDIESINIDEVDKVAQEYFEKERNFMLQQQQYLKKYYDLYFPFERIYDWLSYSLKTKSGKEIVESDYFKRREISYIVKSRDGNDEFCLRHLCYHTPQEFRNDVINYTPLRIDIGPVCDREPKVNKDQVQGVKAIAVEREFVIDIDLSDYDNIRTCCKGKKMCSRCW